jgi:tetratricopeptide (TPR) repeat protein
VSAGRDKAMESCRQFMASTTQTFKKFTAMLRLANLEMQRSEEQLQKKLQTLEEGVVESRVDINALRKNSYVDAIKLYHRAAVAAASEQQRAAAVLAKAAQDMFALKKYTQAAVAARQVLEVSHGAKADVRRTAWKIIARAEFEKGDYARAEVAYKITLRLTDKQSEDRGLLEDGLAAAVYKQGEYMKSKGNLRASMSQFSRVQQLSPDPVVVVSAEYDIAAGLLATQQWQAAIKKLLLFKESHAAGPLTKNTPEQLVNAYLKPNNSFLAAKELEKIAAPTLDAGALTKTAQREALWQAAALYEKAQEATDMVRVYKRYIQRFPRPLETRVEA